MTAADQSAADESELSDYDDLSDSYVESLSDESQSASAGPSCILVGKGSTRRDAACSGSGVLDEPALRPLRPSNRRRYGVCCGPGGIVSA